MAWRRGYPISLPTDRCDDAKFRLVALAPRRAAVSVLLIDGSSFSIRRHQFSSACRLRTSSGEGVSGLDAIAAPKAAMLFASLRARFRTHASTPTTPENSFIVGGEDLVAKEPPAARRRAVIAFFFRITSRREVTISPVDNDGCYR